jgi:mycofactocin system glycosyltransferase
VVIPCRDNASGLARVLSALPTTRCIVVDDASKESASLEQAATAHGATYVRLETPSGPAAARNIGVAHASTPFVLFVDSDVIIDDGEALIAELGGTFVDPLVGAAAPRVRGEGTGILGSFERQHGALDLGANAALVRPGGSVSYVPTAVLMVRRQACDDGFASNLRTGEDVDFVWRLHDRGWLIRYEADLEVHHPSRDTFAAWWRQRQSYGASAAALAERHPDRLAPLRADVLTASVWFAALIGRWSLIGPLLTFAIRGMTQQLPASLADRDDAARQIVLSGVGHAGRPLSRSLVRSFLPVLVVGLVPRRTRRLSATLLVVGTLARLWGQSVTPATVGLSLADDAAYSVGLFDGAFRHKQFGVLVPRLSWRTAGLALRTLMLDRSGLSE